MEKKNEKLEAIRREIPFKIKEQVDAWFDAIDRAYEVGCRDTEQKLNLPAGIGDTRLQTLIKMTDYIGIYNRCLRELKNSTSPAMLLVAHNYCELFCNLLDKDDVDTKTRDTLRWVWKMKKKQFE